MKEVAAILSVLSIAVFVNLVAPRHALAINLDGKAPMTTAQLEAYLVPGRKVAWHNTQNGAKGETHYLADGKTYGTANGGRWTGNGTFKIDGSKVCWEWDSWRTECGYLFDIGGGKFRQLQENGNEQYIDIRTVE